jgi:SAM-dependent methyltransferase
LTVGPAPEQPAQDPEPFGRYLEDHRHRVELTAGLVAAAAPPAGPILDVGASPVSPILPKLWPGRAVHVVDPDPRWSDLDRQGIHFARGSIMDESLPFADGTFAAVVASEVFEHVLECPEHLLARLARVTAPGGLVAVTVPNQARLANRIRLLFGRSVAESPSLAYHRPWMGYGHLHEYTLGEVRREFHAPSLATVRVGAFDPYDRGKFQPIISLVGALQLTGWREVLYGIYRRTG